MKQVFFQTEGSSRYYDDSGWGHKSDTNYNLILFTDNTFSIELNGCSLDADCDSMTTFVTEIKGKIIGNFAIIAEYNAFEKEIKCESTGILLEILEKTSGSYENNEFRTETKENIQFQFKVLGIKEASENIIYKVVFSNDCKEAIFRDFYTEGDWFY